MDMKISKYLGGNLKVVKIKLTRIWGLALTVVLLVGLLVPAMATPVSASNLAWTTINLPNNKTNFQLLSATSANVYDIGADGKIMFAYSNAAAGLPVNTGDNGKLFKSTDGGNTWATTNLGGGTPSLNGITNAANTAVTILKISPQYATDTTVMAAVQTPTGPQVWRSIDGGQTFGQVGGLPIPAGMTITSMDVSPYYNGGQGILVGWSNGLGGGGGALFTTTTLSWVIFGTAGAAGQTGYIPGDVVGVAFSPNHVSDAEYFAAVSNTATSIANALYAGKTVLEAKLGGNNWNNDVLPATLTGDVADTPAQPGLIATFAFPSDYDWSGNNRVFVGLGSPTPIAMSGMDVFRVNGTLAGGGTVSRTYDLNTNGTGAANATTVSSIAFKGPLATGTLAAATYTSMTINRSTNAINNSPDWFQSTNNPIGTSGPVVKFLPTSNTLYVGTAGTHSALSTSSDYNNFAAFSLVSVRNIDWVRPKALGCIDANTWFMIIVDRVNPLYNSGTAGAAQAGDFGMVFKTTNAGTNWQMVWTHLTTGTEELNTFATSPTYATDQTIYIRQTDYRIWKSSDGGASWVGYTAPNNVNITTMVLVDANTYFIGSTAGVYKVGNYTAATIDGRTVNSFLYIDASNFFLGTKDGYVYQSTDNGSTWNKIGSDPSTEDPAGSVFVTRDAGYATNKTLYATNSHNGQVYRFVVGTSASFEKITNGSLTGTLLQLNGAAATISSVTRTADNSLYVNTNAINTIRYRNVNPTVSVSNQIWEPIGPSAANNNNAITGWPIGAAQRDNAILNTSTPSQPSNTIIVIAENLQGTNNTSNGYSSQLVTLTDTLISAPAISAQKANAQVNPQSTFSWTPISSPVTLTYEIQIATDDQFQGVVIDKLTQASSYYATVNDGLVQGTKYYWRVFVAPAVATGNPNSDSTGTNVNTNPFGSKRPAAVPFLIKLGTVGNSLEGASGNRIAPAAGATNVPIRPTFEWAPIQGADSYELELADNPFFANSQAKKPLQNTVWTWDKDLNYGTTYYWRVRAVAAGNASDWISSVFTTMPAPGPSVTAAAPTTVTVTPTAAPKFFDPQSGLYFNTQQELQAYQSAHQGAQQAPATPAYIWVIIIIGAILVIAVIVLIARTRRV